jgi:hypothetical protein
MIVDNIEARGNEKIALGLLLSGGGCGCGGK